MAKGKSHAAAAQDDPGPSSQFPIVGVVASAGGLDAFKRLLSAMPRDLDAAFILVPHLDPTHESLMVSLLARHSTLPVSEIRNGDRVTSGHVYVIPPNAELSVENRILRIVPLTARQRSQPVIDSFLRSLATDQRDLAVGIVLSGTGHYGTLGLREVKAQGGLVIAQAPTSAEHPEMAQSAISAGIVDLVLGPGEIPEALARCLRDRTSDMAGITQDDLSQLLMLLQTRTKRDFRGYRRNTLVRRLRRRMVLRAIDRAKTYLTYLRGHDEELSALARDLSIGVTSFFRDPAAYEVLAREVVPALVQRTAGGSDGERPVRIWVPGCATGEEAYSIAILFLEHFAETRQPVRLQIFATDIDETALEVARAGSYPEAISADVSPERLQRFFTRTDASHFQVSKVLREVITFAIQNVVTDAPFSKLDFVSCRNLLIYLEPEVQTKVIAIFQFALLPHRYLQVGPAESLGQATDRFETVSRKWRIFRRTGATANPVVEIPILPPDASRLHVVPRREARGRAVPAVGELLQRALLEDFVPAAVLIDHQFQILSMQGPVVDFLKFPAGEPTRDLLAMARPGLRTAIRKTCREAISERRPAAAEDARVKRQERYAACTVMARPVARPGGGELLLVTFHDREVRSHVDGSREEPAATVVAADDTKMVRRLEADLKATREDLQGTIEEVETTNLELKASHEEVVMMNEELQSTNEELESSKEELQSLNEELATVNSQLQEKVHELDTTNNDLVNLLASTEIAAVFLDTRLRIKRFTPQTARLLNLLPSDLGRPFTDIASRVTDAALPDDCRQVLDKLSSLEALVQSGSGLTYLRRVLPYRTTDLRIEGVVITWIDITARLEAEAESRRLTAAMHGSRDAVILLDLTGRVIVWNPAASRLYGYPDADVQTMHLLHLRPGDDRAATAERIARIGRGEHPSESFEARALRRDGHMIDVWVTVALLRDSAGMPEAIIVTERDLAEVKEALAARAAARLYSDVVEHMPAGAVLCHHGQLTINRRAESITGYVRSELPTIDDWCTALHPDQSASVRSAYEPANRPGEVIAPVVVDLRRRDGATRQLELSVSRLDETHLLWLFFDITEREEAAALRRSEQWLRSIVEASADAIITVDAEGRMGKFNPAAEEMFGYASHQVVGRNVTILIPAPYRDEYDAYFARRMEVGRDRLLDTPREIMALKKDGTTFPIRLAITEIDETHESAWFVRNLTSSRELEWQMAEGQVEERRHLARELHDEVGGHMTGLGFLAQSLLTEISDRPEPAAKAQALLDGLGQMQQTLRSVVTGLMPVEAIPEGLMAALQHLANQCEAVSGVSCTFACDRPVHVSDASTALHLFRIAQEAVNNAIRHGSPTRLLIGLVERDGTFEINVSDDGRGFRHDPMTHDGFGLRTMRQRAQLLGGDCSISSGGPTGTRVRCWVPAAGNLRRGRRRSDMR